MDGSAPETVFGSMRPITVAVLWLLLSSPLFAQLRIDAGIATGRQSFAPGDIGSTLLISPEVMLSRGRLSLYYALDEADLSSPDIRRGAIYASHFGVAYAWPVGRDFAIRAGAGPSYVTIDYLGGTSAWNAQLEVAMRRGRLEWFAKAREYEFSRSERHVADASTNGPALLAGVRYALKE